MRRIDDLIAEKNIRLDTPDPVAQGGFTMVPNFILRHPDLSIGAKMAYAMFLSYAWHNDHCYPGQERLAQDMGMSRPSVSAFINQLEESGFISVERRGLGLTNVYTIHFQVSARKLSRERGGLGPMRSEQRR